MLPLQDCVPPMAPAENETYVEMADFEELFRQYQKPITKFIFYLIGNREQADDLAQDVFVKAYKALGSGTLVRTKARSAWLYRIAVNTSTDVLRRRRLITWLSLSLFYDDRGIGAGVPQEMRGEEEKRGSTIIQADSHVFSYTGGRFEEEVADRELIERVFQQLRPTYAACLRLYEIEGRSCAEIAEILAISYAAVKMRLMRARAQFLEIYKREIAERDNERGSNSSITVEKTVHYDKDSCDSRNAERRSLRLSHHAPD